MVFRWSSALRSMSLGHIIVNMCAAAYWDMVGFSALITARQARVKRTELPRSCRGICMGFYLKASLYRTATISTVKQSTERKIVGSTLYSYALNVLVSRVAFLSSLSWRARRTPLVLICRILFSMARHLGRAIYEGWMTEGPASTWSSLTDSLLVIIM